MPIGVSERAQLLELTTQLAAPELSLAARLELVEHMRQVLAGQTAYALPVPAKAIKGLLC